jgi:hypothetical protein
MECALCAQQFPPRLHPVPLAYCTIRGDLDVRIAYFGSAFWDFWHNVETGKRGVSALVRIKRRDAYQPMHSTLRSEIPAGRLAGNPDHGRFDADFVSDLNVDYGSLVASSLKPAKAHAQNHTIPVASNCSAKF